MSNNIKESMNDHNKPALSPYGRWLSHKNLLDAPIDKKLYELWAEFEQQCQLISTMQQNAIDKPIIMKEFTSPEQQQFNRAIELLEACSEDLFIADCDQALEAQVDEFIKEVKS